MDEKIIQRLKEVLDEMSSHTVVVKRDDLEILIKEYERLVDENLFLELRLQ